MRPPEFTWVRPTTLLVDETYQRGISSRSIKLIGRIVANWDWARFKPPVVAVTAGGLEVIDGQHTAIAAASHGGIAEIPVMIVGAPDMADRARSFIGHNLDRVAITPAQLHAANIAGANPDALVVERVCRAAGVNLLKRQPNCDGYNVNDCQAYQRVYRLVINRGPGAATTILKTLADARPNRSRSGAICRKSPGPFNWGSGYCAPSPAPAARRASRTSARAATTARHWSPRPDRRRSPWSR